MIPMTLVVGLGLGLLPRWWPHRLAVTAGLALLVSLAFGFVIGHPLVGGGLALANTAVGIGVGRFAQGVVLRPPSHPGRAA